MGAYTSLQSQGATPLTSKYSGTLLAPFSNPFSKSAPVVPQQSIGTGGSGTNNLNPLPSGVNSSSQQKKVTTDVAGNTTTIHPAQSNPSVLAQQQALNKLGYGLVEDGVAGPKTSAAIADAASKSSKVTTTGATTEKPAPPPASLTVAGQSPGVLSSGNQTTNEKQTFSGLINQSQAPSQAYTDATNKYQEAVSNLSTLKQNLAKYTQGIEAQGIPMAGIVGQEANLSKSASAQLDAAQQAVTEAEQGLSYANTQQGLEVQAGTAANAAAQNQAARSTGAQENVLGAVAPITGVPYGTQTVQPGLLGNNATQTGDVNVDPNNPVASIPNLADAVINGRMTIDQANSALGGGLGLSTNLRNQILSKNPQFNFTQSSASAATQATGQQVNTFSTSANAALDKLTSDFANLPDWQKFGIPGSIGIEQGLGKFFGNDKLATYQTTLHDARAQLSGVLATAGGMTPTSAGDTAQTYLPDNMTKDQLPAKIAAAKALVAQKVSAFQNSGAQNQTASSSGTISTPYGAIDPNL